MVRLKEFITRVYEIVKELKIPLIDERIYSNLQIDEMAYPSVVTFTFSGDESVIRGFLGLCEFYHGVVLKQGDEFYIPHQDKLFHLRM